MNLLTGVDIVGYYTVNTFQIIVISREKNLPNSKFVVISNCYYSTSLLLAQVGCVVERVKASFLRRP